MEFSTLNGYKVKDKKAIRYYDSVDTMKNDSTLKEGMHAKTKGYYSVNDGGASEYHITVTESNSEYQEELENGLYATLILKDYITPEMFGAYGDNTHNDTISLQRALNFASSNNIPLIISKGIFLTDGLTCNDITIKSFNATLKAKSNTDTYLLTVNGKPTIEGLIFDGDNVIDGLLHINGLECNITNSLFKKCLAYGIDNTMSSDNEELAHIENVKFSNCSGGIILNGKGFDNPDNYKGKVEFINCKTEGDSGNSQYNRLYYFSQLNYVYVNGGEFTGNSTYASTNLYKVNHGEIIGGYYHDIERGVTLGQITKNCIVCNTINENITGAGGLHIDLVTGDRVYPMAHSIISNNIVKNAYRGMFIQGKNMSINNNYIYCGTNTSNSGGIIRFNDSDDNTAKSNITLDNLFIYNIGDIEDIIHCDTTVINIGKVYVEGSNVDYASFKSTNLCYKLNKNEITGNSYYVKFDDDILFINASATTNIYLPSTTDSKLCGRKITIIRTDDTENSVRLRCRSDNGTINGVTSSTDGARITKGVNNIIQTGVGEYYTY